MPRAARHTTCATCRQRKVKCDGTLPVCLNCRKGSRECQRPEKDLKFIIHSFNPVQASKESFLEFREGQQGLEPSRLEDEFNEGIELGAIVTYNPQAALQSPVIASLFRHYIDFLAPWYDLNDSHNLFGTLVPTRALSNAILFKALIAFAACHHHRVSARMARLGPAYHAACVRDLLAEMDNIHSDLLGDYLAATCLLRSYEILNGNTRQQQHLLGAYSFAVTEPVDLGTWGLPQAGTWNYLREEITMGLESSRAVRISTTFKFNPGQEMSDDMWANAISFLLAKVINFHWGKNEDQTLETKVLSWNSLSEEVTAWREHRPATFNSFSTAPKKENVFPSIWLLKPWHVAGEQYCSIAKILLSLSEPLLSTTDHVDLGRESRLLVIQEEALRVCGLSFTNSDIAARVNAFGPLAFCGRYLSNRIHREALISMLQNFSLPTGWPVYPIIEDLQKFWCEN